MNQLFKAIVLEVAFSMKGYVDGSNVHTMEVGVDVEQRGQWFGAEVQEILKNSNLPTDGSFRALTSDLVVEALQIKLNGYFRSLEAPTNEYVLVYADTMTRVGSSFSVIKTDYKQRAAADRAAAKLTSGHSMVIAVTKADYMKAARGVVRRNMMASQASAEEVRNGYTGYFVEGRGTPSYCSPASESYWSM